MIAIYVRQSVEKKDSISIESQIETCRRKLSAKEEAHAEVFSDKGFSGKSTVNRPEFQRMMELLRSNRLTKIIVYKVDRISRSMLDFLKMKEEFDKYDVPFVSCCEDFDTSSASGKMMLNLLIMFAEMEREAIQKRITDNYYARGEKGFYLGGYAPFGYNKVSLHVNGKKTCTFEENNKEIAYVKEIYRRYTDCGESLNSIAAWLNGVGISTRKNCRWGNTAVARILMNPTYVKANAEVYTYIKSMGGTMSNPAEDYCLDNGLIVYGKPQNRTSAKYRDYNGEFVTAGFHKGIIEPEQWLSAQYSIRQNTGHTNLGSGSLSWLQGIVKCRSCGSSAYVKRYRNKNGKEFRYFYCRGKKQGTCNAFDKMPVASAVEQEVEAALLSRLQELSEVVISFGCNSALERNSLEIKLSDINGKLDNLINALADGSQTLGDLLSAKIETLAKERESTENAIVMLDVSEKKHNSFSPAEVLRNWSGYDIEIKKNISKTLLEKILLDGENIEIYIN